MTDDATQSRRNVFRSKWSKILKAEEGSAHHSLDSNVTDFLRGTQIPVVGVPAPPPMSTRPDKSPRIDVSIAQRWPDAAQLRPPSANDHRIPAPIPAETTGRARRRKGLVVRFSADPPEIIGHGGDATREPTVEISYNRPAAVRSESDRKPVEPADVVLLADRSHLRPGIADRSQSTQGPAAFSRLAAAGIFAERASSRESRHTTDSEEDLHPGFRDRQHTSQPESLHNSPSTPEYDRSRPMFSSVTPPRRPLPLPQISAPPDDRSHHRAAYAADAAQDVLLRQLRPDGNDDMNKTRQRMRQEEGRAFSQAFRHSQTYPDDTGSLQRPDPQSSSHSPIGRRPVPSPSVSSDGRSYLASVPQPSQEALSLRKRPSPSPARIAAINASQPPSFQAEGSRSPPDGLGHRKGSSGLAPQDYIEFFRAKTASRSNSAVDRNRHQDSQGALHDSPLQSQPAERGHERPIGLGLDQATMQQSTPSLSQHTQPSVRKISPRGTESRRPVPPAGNETRDSNNNAVTVRASDIRAVVTAGPEQSQLNNGTQGELSRSDSNVTSPRIDPRGVASADDFAARVNQMKGVFRLTAEKEQSNAVIKTRSWLRCAYWWLQKGKLELDLQARTQQRGLLTQSHVDVAKSWWILTEVIDQGPVSEDRDDASDTNTLRTHLRSLCLFMSRQDLMPPHAALIQGQDMTIWIKYPRFSPDIEYLLGVTAQTDVTARILPLEDSEDYFLYQRMFVTASINTEDPRSDRVRLPCILSIVRHKLHYRASIFIGSQNGLINVLVGQPVGKEQKGPTWYDISWKAKSCAFSIQLPRGLPLNVNLDEGDYRSLSNMLEFTRSIDKSFNPGPTERLVYSTQLYDATYFDVTRVHSFPDGKVRIAFLGMFQDVRVQQRQNTTQKSHHAYRLLLITPTTSRTLGLVNHVYDGGSPFDVEFIQASPEMPGPTVMLHSPAATKPWRLLLEFDSKQAFSSFLDVLQGTFRAVDEYVKVNLSLTGLSMQAIGSPSPERSTLSVLQHLQWRDANIVTRRDEKPVTVLSDSLRIVLNHQAGSLVDRLNFLPGELLIRLNVSSAADSANTIELARRPQSDAQLVINRGQVLPATLDKLRDVGRALFNGPPTLRQLSFATSADLHAFEQELTGCRVSFDALPCLFSITRRTKVVTMHKKLEATRVRLQVLTKADGGSSSGGGDSRLVVAFFEDFAAADAMVIEVKGSDDFERVKGGGSARFGVRLVEAKFSLPKRGGDDGEQPGEEGGGVPGDIPASIRSRFVNLEGLDYAEEHDDIVIGFEDESDADGFCDALPGTVQAAGRNFLVRRRN